MHDGSDFANRNHNHGNHCFLRVFFRGAFEVKTSKELHCVTGGRHVMILDGSHYY
jgi:hypothetical protein